MEDEYINIKNNDENIYSEEIPKIGNIVQKESGRQVNRIDLFVRVVVVNKANEIGNL